ncbi:MAG: hypothetical protein ACRED5_08955 [Propylenella sp.]
MQTVICMKWGAAYGVDYANTLYSMVSRNTARPLRFICFTDSAAGLRPEILPYPLPPIELPPSHQWKPWRKIALLNRTLADLHGPVLFFDLDVVVTGSIDPFFDFKPDETYCVIENWTQMGEGIGNTSVFRLRVGAHPEVYETLLADPAALFAKYRNSQTFASRTISRMSYWPAEWCVSFKHTLMPRWPLNFIRTTPLPVGARVVCFTGLPNPDHARDGIWPTTAWWKAAYKHVRPTPWIAEHWR